MKIRCPYCGHLVDVVNGKIEEHYVLIPDIVETDKVVCQASGKEVKTKGE